MPAPHILVVEDDPIGRDLLQIALANRGYSVLAAANAAEAQECLSPAKINGFECVVTDYRMPAMNGLELLGWIRERDPGLATILVTAQCEKELVADSLRGGAIDFIDKPVDIKTLQQAVARAVEQTRRYRHMAESESAVREIGRTQQRILDAHRIHGRGIVEVHFYPKHEAGGDYFTHFQFGGDRLFCLLTDVSGHDPQAAYVSAYFQGYVRGLLQRNATVPEIFYGFNRLLLREWNQDGDSANGETNVETSVAACAVQVDFSNRTARVFAQGTPAPVYLSQDGAVGVVGESGGTPLGWFPTLPLQQVIHPIADGNSLYLWTDGFEDLADRLGVSRLSLACALQQAKERSQPPACIQAANDDVLMAVVHLAAPEPAEDLRPLISESYHGGQSTEIDEMQSYWRRSLAIAIPELTDSQMHDILLASREIMLNALIHGCARRADRKADFQIAYLPKSRTLRVRVDDPGPGHRFDIARQERLAALELVEAQQGLLLVERLASHLAFERGGAGVKMDFKLSSDPSTEANVNESEP